MGRARSRERRNCLSPPEQGSPAPRCPGIGNRQENDRNAAGAANLVASSAHGFHAVIARIVGDHRASIALHEGCGFTLVGVEKQVGRKFGRWLDVVELQRLL